MTETTEDDAEPDYRFTLANERTFLSWIRTSLALLAAAVALAHIVPEFGFPGASRGIAVALAALATLTAATSVVRWRRVESALRRGAPLPPVSTPWVLAGALGVVAVLVAALTAFGSGQG